MISDAEIADHVLALYGGSNAPAVKWDYVSTRANDDGVVFALRRLNGFDLIVLEGTASIDDLVRDLIAVQDPYTHPQLGPLHVGFWTGMSDCWSEVRKLLRQPAVITGHSLGAARAAILTGLMVANDCAPARRVTFGEPRCGTLKLRILIEPVSTTVYHNKRDIISDMPVPLPLFPYCDSAMRTDINVWPNATQYLWGPLAWHHMELYRKGLDQKKDPPKRVKYSATPPS